MGECVGGKDGEDWHRIRSHIDRHFNMEGGMALLPHIVSYTDEWLQQLPQLPTTRVDEKDGRFYINAEDLSMEIPPKVIGYSLFGELLDEKVYKVNFAGIDFSY